MTIKRLISLDDHSDFSSMHGISRNDDPSAIAAANEEREHLRNVLSDLPAIERRAVGMRHGIYGPGLTFEELGNRLGCSRETARKRVKHAESRLKEMLE